MKKRKGFYRLTVIALIAAGCCGCGCGDSNVNSLHVESFSSESESLQSEPVSPAVSEPSLTPEPTPEPTPTPIPTPEPEVISITVSAAGDVSLGVLQIHEYAGTFREMYDLQGPDYFFQNVLPIFEEDDMTIVNFEGVLTESTDMVEKQYNIKGDPVYIEILPLGSIEAVSFGNNHRMDYGQQGSNDTVALFKENNISYAYNKNLGIYETQGIRIGFVSVNEVNNGETVEIWLENGIKQLQEENVDLIFACCHWGIEREDYPTDYQQELGRKCIDWGADLVLGCHPHILQGIEVYNGKFILYSMGNFCFGGNRNPADKETMIFQQTFTFIDGVKQEDRQAKVIPCYISSVMSRNDYCPTPAEGSDYVSILERINTLSEPFNTKFAEDGSYIIPGE
ncbi:MAG: CapA family protein [Acetatifactor sp.]|nr:CapA family protein [Acetatifactor sp.]